MLLEAGPDADSGARGGWALYGKTGLVLKGGGPGDVRDDIPVGWLVGYAERGGEVFPFALNVSPRPGVGLTWRDLVPVRLGLARAMLERLGVLP